MFIYFQGLLYSVLFNLPYQKKKFNFIRFEIFFAILNFIFLSLFYVSFPIFECYLRVIKKQVFILTNSLFSMHHLFSCTILHIFQQSNMLFVCIFFYDVENKCCFLMYKTFFYNVNCRYFYSVRVLSDFVYNFFFKIFNYI